MKVVLSDIGGITAPVTGSGSDPTWMRRVPKPCGCEYEVEVDAAISSVKSW